MAKAPSTFESAFQVYSVISVIGEGGTGRVFAVKDNDGQPFAVKCLFPDRVTTERQKRFKNEIDFCSKCRHPNVIRVADYGIAVWDGKKCPFYVMPIFPTTLHVLIGGKLAPDKILPIFNQILNGVEAAHLLGVFHRDLKPENILCSPTGDSVVVADFGIARFNEDIIATPVKTTENARMANFRYSAPEQRVKGGDVNIRADIFALGLILNEMFTQSVPQGAGYVTIHQVAPVFAYLDTLVEKMIQQNQAARPGSIEEIKKELIGRRNEFVAFQELDAKRREVIPAASPPAFEPIQLKNVDWQQGTLLLKLNRDPGRGWVERFHSPQGSYSYTAETQPKAYDIVLDRASIRIEERHAQMAVDHFKMYLEIANRDYLRQLEDRAKRLEQEQRERLRQEIEEAERRDRILKTLKV